MITPSEQPANQRDRRIQASATDLDLLQYFEPVLHFTQGEQFFPTEVNEYVQDCSLWAH